jgi:uncharacterized protein (TIGR02594 family)
MTTPWLDTMQSEVGVAWAPGDGANSTIIEWLHFIANAYPDMAGYCAAAEKLDYFSWCGLTVGYCLTRNGIHPVFGSADTDQFLYAMAWLEWGTQVSIPQVGDIVVFNFGGGDHHVTFFVADNGNGYWACLGGNQGHKVQQSNFPKSSVMGVRRPPAAGQIAVPPSAPPTSSGLPSNQVFTDIYATMFGGSSDFNTSAYDGKIITDGEYGVAFPARIPAPLPHVAVNENGKTCICVPRDVGPWNTHDSYWLTGSRPAAESQFDNKTSAQNGHIPVTPAGIDLTPAVDSYLGNHGGSRVTWWFVDASTPLGPSSLSIPGTPPMSAPPPLPIPLPVPPPQGGGSASGFDPSTLSSFLAAASMLLQKIAENQAQQPSSSQPSSSSNMAAFIPMALTWITANIPTLSTIGLGAQVFASVMGWMAPMIHTGAADASTTSQAVATTLGTAGLAGVVNWIKQWLSPQKSPSQGGGSQS